VAAITRKFAGGFELVVVVGTLVPSGGTECTIALPKVFGMVSRLTSRMRCPTKTVTPPLHTVVMNQNNQRTSARRNRNKGRNRGRFTPRGFVDLDSRARRPCGCEACEAEMRGEPFDHEASWQRTCELVDRLGMAIQGVSGSSDSASWAYTIGRVQRGLPEIVVVGMAPEQCAHLINQVTDHWPEVLDGQCDSSVQLLPVASRVWTNTTYVAGAYRFARERGLADEFQVVQAVWPDREGRFPWDPDCSVAVRKAQPMLGLLST
jgi:Domain of unknown function (DUF4262)